METRGKDEAMMDGSRGIMGWSGDLKPLTYHFQPFCTGEQHKKEMLVDGQTHLVLIREEAGAPDAKVRCGVGRVSWLGSALAREWALVSQV